MNLFFALSVITVTLHTSVPSPSLRNPQRYGLNTCTGVFVGPDEILTAAHCVAESRGHQWAKTVDGESLALSIKKIDRRKDLALLKVKKPFNHAFTSLGDPVGRGQAVYTVNSGADYANTYNTGLVNNLILEDDYNILTILHNAWIMPGASGSGLFNDKKQLIGINVATFKGFAEAVDVQEIRSFLDPRL